MARYRILVFFVCTWHRYQLYAILAVCHPNTVATCLHSCPSVSTSVYPYVLFACLQSLAAVYHTPISVASPSKFSVTVIILQSTSRGTAWLTRALTRLDYCVISMTTNSWAANASAPQLVWQWAKLIWEPGGTAYHNRLLAFIGVLWVKHYLYYDGTCTHGADPLPPSPMCSMTGSNHLNEEFTPLLPTGTGERF